MKRFSPVVRFRVEGLHDCGAWHAALAEAGKFGNIPVPDVAVRQAAMSGFDLRGYKVFHLIIDEERQAVHLQLQKSLPSAAFLLPVIHFTDDNYHPVHGPNKLWWEAMEACRWGSEGTYLVEPLVEEIKEALGGLDMTGVFVRWIGRSVEGYQIRVDAGAFDAVPNM